MRTIPRPPLLRRWEASQYLREVHGLQFAPSTLGTMACLGKGPEVTRVNNVPYYRAADLDAWAKALIKPPRPAAKLVRASNPSTDSANA